MICWKLMLYEEGKVITCNTLHESNYECYALYWVLIMKQFLNVGRY